MDKSARAAIAATARAVGIAPERISAALAAMDDRIPKGEITALAVQQARVCEMLSCSRHHVRKLEHLGLLKPVYLAGLKRYLVSDVLKLLGAV